MREFARFGSRRLNLPAHGHVEDAIGLLAPFKEATMRKMLAFAVLGAVLVTTGVFMVRSTPTGAAPVATGPSAFQMMAGARDLPVAPTPHAF